MGRPRKYQTAAERAAAYRKRVALRAERERQAQAVFAGRLQRLKTAVEEAARSGDVTARNCQAESIGTMLDLLAEHFEALRGWHQRHGDEGW
jgi:hypothetical protein